eukprot:TRINITY_DN13636_c6_g1_i1.p1 TRINITY_DN13636_c6_g1~~TRINITY_DN13636_c6_g1_i1.p1  ORF type:complete len:717 (+),score=145.78 TRINITY_DN13636_c6_g1_i1:68-2218(+)
MPRGRRQELDPAVAAQQLSEHVLKKGYTEAEELLSRGIKVDVLQKIEEKNEEGETITKFRSALHMVVEAGDIEGLEWLARQGSSPNVALDKGNSTIIHYCVEHEKVAVLTRIIELADAKELRAPDLNKIDDNNYTPTQLAILHNKVDIGKLLLKAGADHDFDAQTFTYQADSHCPGLPATQVQVACASGDINLLETLYELGAPLFKTDRNGDTLLHIAVKNRQWAIFDSLVEKSLSLDTVSAAGETLLSTVLQQQNQQHRLEDATALLSKGYEITAMPKSELPALHQAIMTADEALVGILLDAGAALSQKDKQGNTSIHHAARLDTPDVLQKLTTADEKKNGEFSVNDTNRRGQTPLHIACKNSKACNAKILLALPGINQNIQCNNLSSPLHEACRYSSLACVEELLAKSKALEKSPEEQQTKKPPPKGKKDAPRDEECHKTELELEDVNGDTVLQVAMQYEWPEIVNALIECKVSVERTSRKYGTLLHQSVHTGSTEIARILISGGASVHKQDSQSKTPIRIAVEKGFIQLTELLIEQGASVNVQDEHYGLTPLHVAAKNGDCDSITLLVKSNASIEARDHQCRTPLHHAAASSTDTAVELLLSLGAQIGTRDAVLRSPLHDACESDNVSTAKALISHGADVTALDNQKWLPIHVACCSGSVSCVQLLIDAGSPLNQVDARDRIPLSVAAESCKVEVARLLVKNWTAMKQRRAAA